MNKKQIKASLPPGVLPMSQERSQEILRHARNNPPVKACRTKSTCVVLLKNFRLLF